MAARTTARSARKNAPHRCIAQCLAFALATALIGCKAKEAASAGFATTKLMAHDPHLPFHKAWRKPGVDFRRYTKLYVAEVNTDYMLRQTGWQNGERGVQIEADVKKLGAYARHTIEKAFREDPRRRFEVLDAPSSDPAALQIEFALTEVVPSKVVLNALGYAPFGIGMGITAVRTVTGDQSSVAFEGRVRDAATGEVIAMAADRESEQFAPVSVRGLTWYSHAETIVAEWAQQFVQVLARSPGETVKDTDTFTLKLW